MYLVPLLLISQGLAQPGVAEVETSVQAESSVTQVAYDRVTRIEEGAFTGLSLEGELIRPAGMLGVVVPRPGFHPLFQLRRNFELEISESPSSLGRLSLP
jgi:hypothetical protein